MEEWKQLWGLSSYWISNTGKVKRVYNNGKTKILKPDVYNGYLRVNLCEHGEKIIRRVNRLVAQAWIPNPNNLPIVMHLDDDRSNNHVSNLRWGTHKDNVHDCISKGRFYPTDGKVLYREKVS
jgi:hypothetical protein